MNWENHLLKNRIKKRKTDNQCQNAACEQKTTCEKWKFGLKKFRRRMNYEWIGKTIQKNPIQKIEKK